MDPSSWFGSEQFKKLLQDDPSVTAMLQRTSEEFIRDLFLPAGVSPGNLSLEHGLFTSILATEISTAILADLLLCPLPGPASSPLMPSLSTICPVKLASSTPPPTTTPRTTTTTTNTSSTMMTHPEQVKISPHILERIEKRRFVRDYQCPFPKCPSGHFRTKWELRIHIYLHRDEKPYLCVFDECGTRFSQPIILCKDHMLTHAKRTPLWNCPFGCEKYETATAFRLHLRDSHRIVGPQVEKILELARREIASFEKKRKCEQELNQLTEDKRTLAQERETLLQHRRSFQADKDNSSHLYSSFFQKSEEIPNKNKRKLDRNVKKQQRAVIEVVDDDNAKLREIEATLKEIYQKE